MEIGCNTVAFRKHPLEYALERIAAAGYRYVEVEANLSWCPHAYAHNQFIVSTPRFSENGAVQSEGDKA